MLALFPWVRLRFGLAARLLLAGLLISCAPPAPTPTESEGEDTPHGEHPPADQGTLSATGQWSAPFSWANVAVHLVLLPNGRVMSFGRTANGVPKIWNPSSGTFTSAPSPSLLFCAGQVLLPDGRLFVAGGHLANYLGLPNGNIYTASSNSWQATPAMAQGRWYPSTTVLPNGEVVVLGGTDEQGDTVPVPEVWKTGAGGWRRLTAAARILPYYPRTFVAPNGRVFLAGELQATYYLSTSGTGSWSLVGNRVYPVRDYGPAVMYSPGKIIYIGGGNPPTNTVETIDLNQASPVWRSATPMKHARRHHNATLLPTGEVLVMGGTSLRDHDPAGAVFEAEIWSPSTGAWTPVASHAVKRLYHSTSLLLPDGRVLLAGSGDAAGMVDEYNAELFSPPYLFKGARPTISAMPSAVSYGQKVTITTPDASRIAKVTWIRLGSSTHAFDFGQRLAQPGFSRGSGTLTVQGFTNRNRVPPGHYMVFLVDTNGVPSVARIIKLF